MDFVNDDWVVMVERTKLAMMESLPMAMQQKKFGTWGKCSILCIVNFKTTFLRNWGEPCCSIKKYLGSVTCHACMLNLIMRKHALIYVLCNMCFTESHLQTDGNYVLFVTIFILMIMNVYTHIS